MNQSARSERSDCTPSPAGHDPKSISLLVELAAEGDDKAKSLLTRRIYDELHRLASSLMRQERLNHTLQPTALINEALLRLLGPEQLVGIRSRRMLFFAAATAMRHVLVEYARRRNAAKRGGGWKRTSIDEAIDILETTNVQLEKLQEAMQELGNKDSQSREIVDLRFFVGMPVQEIAKELNVSESTVEKRLKRARLVLLHAMKQ